MTMPQHDPAKERSWRRLLQLWRQSGLTVRDFCARHAVQEASFYAWRRELARRDRQKATTTKSLAAPRPAAAFVELAIAADEPKPAAIEVVVAGGRLLRVRWGFDAELLRRLVRVLEEPAC
jgi:transposase-like protein